jgi:hypothetical protein
MAWVALLNFEKHRTAILAAGLTSVRISPKRIQLDHSAPNVWFLGQIGAWADGVKIQGKICIK